MLNEPKDQATTVVLNPIYAEAIKEIRRTNPRRTIFVGPGKWNQAGELPNLRLPDNGQPTELVRGKVVASGGSELAEELERSGYAAFAGGEGTDGDPTNLLV